MTDKPRLTTYEQGKKYVEQGIAVVPIPHKEKGPRKKGWQKLRINESNFDDYFHPRKHQNIGAILGTASKGLVDIDLDNEIARDLAKPFLPKTHMVFGRKSNPNSHYMYICEDIQKTIQLQTKQLGMIVELRANGVQTVVPPSVHPSGEDVEFTHDTPKAAKVDENALVKAVRRLAAATILVENYPTEGRRHNAMMPLATLLLKANFTPDEAHEFIQTVADYAGDEEYAQRGGIVFDTARKLEEGQPVQGIPTLKEYIGEEAVNDLCKILKISAKDASASIECEDEEPLDLIDWMNQKYAYIILGSRGNILHEYKDHEGKAYFDFMTLDAFNNYYANKNVTINKNKKNEQKLSYAKLWLKSPRRRTYDGLEFAPENPRENYYNTWKGFPIQAGNVGGCPRYLEHVYENICSGNKEHFEWLMAWMGDIIQNPAKKLGTAVAIRGKQGTGKSMFAGIFGSLLGDHYVIANHPRLITGNFNSHFMNCLLLHAEEGFWAGDKSSEGKLKDLITGTEQFVEFKGKDPIMVKNYIRLLITGNPDWIVPAGMEERRFFVLEASDAKMQDHDYFGKIAFEMKAGGREALMHHLLNVDLSLVNLRQVPKTEALLEQKLSSLDNKMQWWLDILSRGRLPGQKLWLAKCGKEELINSYYDYANKVIGKPRQAETIVGGFIHKVVPNVEKHYGKYEAYSSDIWEEYTTEGTYYIFPPLQECRAYFESLIGQEVDWEK